MIVLQVLLMILPVTTIANTDPVIVLQQALKAEQASLQKLKSGIENLKQSQTEKLAHLSTRNINDSDLAQAQLALELARMNIQSVRLDQSSTQNQIKKIQQQITELQNQKKELVKSTTPKTTANFKQLETNLKQLQSLLALKQQQLSLFNERGKLVQQKVDLLQKWLNTLQTLMKQKTQAVRHETLLELQQKLQADIQKKQDIINKLQLQLQKITASSPDDHKRQIQLTDRIHFLNESINLLNTKLKLTADKAELEGIDIGHLELLTPEQINQWLTTIGDIKKQLESSITLTQGNSKILHQELELLGKRYQLQEVDSNTFQNEKAQIQSLINAFDKQLQTLESLHTGLNNKFKTLQVAYQSYLSRSLTLRQHLPDKPAQWFALLSELVHLPQVVQQVLTRSWHDLVQGWNNAGLKTRGNFFLLVLLAFGSVFTLSWLPYPVLGPMAENQTFTIKIRNIMYALLRSSRAIILIGAPLLAAAWVFNLESLHLISLLVVIWLAAQWLIQISYWLLVSPLIPVDMRQPHLYHNLLWIISVSAFFTLLVGMGHLGLLSESMQLLLDRIFMLLMLPLTVSTLQLRKIIIQHGKTDAHNAFWAGLVSLLSLIFPLTILAVSLIGLAGYVNLAWFVAEQLIIVMLVLILWLVLRHLMLDGISSLKVLAESYPKHTTFLIRGIIEPLQLVFKFGLLLIMLWLLVYLLGWSSGVNIEGFLKNLLSSPLFTMGKQTIEPLHLIQACLIAFFVIYFGIWSRQLSYELFYRQIHDRGLRNSLSVFTQYIIIVIGLLLALNMLGINLTSLTVFAGALGVGIGFGLQNIANNFISGLILLTERPVRTEDWVTIGDQEGRIKHIGMRSLVLTAWDNQDIIIPNADLITNPVTNWTLSDSLVRTVFEVGVRYQDDPHKAKEVIEEAIAMVPSVYLEKPPQVLLTEFANSSVNFRIQFYSDVETQTSRLQVKSDVMFAIWDALRDADIGIPFPQQDIYIKELPPVNKENQNQNDNQT